MDKNYKDDTIIVVINCFCCKWDSLGEKINFVESLIVK